MKEKIQKQVATATGELVNGAKYEIFEEFGFYTVYINGKMCSSHESLDRAKGKIRYLNDRELDRASNSGNISPRLYRKRKDDKQ